MRKMQKMLVTVALSFALLPGLANSASPKKDYRFVMVPKVVHPWF